ncbi:Clp protease [Sphingomonas laterariae]|uniref:Clp protease n=1 Tax=Edaphosphingomonas laterariae TaxID=861865 RepID=A0A239JKY4_9SPHN|nr:Clp protease ClpP [Sphingomonas laterariae]SNT05973.1 Clp protease [Sphingomonas laterariae]
MNRKLFALARDNAGRGSGIRSEAAGDTATIYIYDVIDAYWGVSAADVAAELGKIDAKNITVRINTPGGDVFEARAIMTLLVEHPATVTAKIDGVAASAGSVIALAADTVEIADGGFYMIHKGWTFLLVNIKKCGENSQKSAIFRGLRPPFSWSRRWTKRNSRTRRNPTIINPGRLGHDARSDA